MCVCVCVCVCVTPTKQSPIHNLITYLSLSLLRSLLSSLSLLFSSLFFSASCILSCSSYRQENKQPAQILLHQNIDNLTFFKAHIKPIVKVANFIGLTYWEASTNPRRWCLLHDTSETQAKLYIHASGTFGMQECSEHTGKCISMILKGFNHDFTKWKHCHHDLYFFSAVIPTVG